MHFDPVPGSYVSQCCVGGFKDRDRSDGGVGIDHHGLTNQGQTAGADAADRAGQRRIDVNFTGDPGQRASLIRVEIDLDRLTETGFGRGKQRGLSLDTDPRGEVVKSGTIDDDTAKTRHGTGAQTLRGGQSGSVGANPAAATGDQNGSDQRRQAQANSCTQPDRGTAEEAVHDEASSCAPS